MMIQINFIADPNPNNWTEKKIPFWAFWWWGWRRFDHIKGTTVEYRRKQ